MTTQDPQGSHPSTNTIRDQATVRASALIESLVEAGTAWASYGLRLGKVALEANAEALKKTAAVLETLATNLAQKTETSTTEAKKEEPAAPTQA